MFIFDANISRLNSGNDMVMKVVEFVFLYSARISKNKYVFLFKELLIVFKSRKKMTMRENYFCCYL